MTQTITLGATYGLWIPPGCNYIAALDYCCAWSVNPKSYKSEFDLLFKGSSAPAILVTNVNRPGCWADAPMGGWGRGQIRICVAAAEKRAWVTKWPKVADRQRVFCGLMFHEMGHLILNTTDQNIGCPLSAAMRARGIAHWGKSKLKATAMRKEYTIEFPDEGLRNSVDDDLMNKIAEKVLG